VCVPVSRFFCIALFLAPPFSRSADFFFWTDRQSSSATPGASERQVVHVSSRSLESLPEVTSGFPESPTAGPSPDAKMIPTPSGGTYRPNQLESLFPVWALFPSRDAEHYFTVPVLVRIVGAQLRHADSPFPIIRPTFLCIPPFVFSDLSEGLYNGAVREGSIRVRNLR